MKELINWLKEGWEEWDDGYRNPSFMPESFDEWVTAIIGGLLGFVFLLVMIFSIFLFGEIVHG